MTLYELWMTAPQCFVFIRFSDGSVHEYIGGKLYAGSIVKSVYATDYPMYKHVLEVTIR